MIEFQMPVNVPVVVTQTFQEHLEAARRMKTKYNGGIDLAVPRDGGADENEEVMVLAAARGQVVQARWDTTGYGNCVILLHSNGFKTLYAHLDEIDVDLKDFLEAGDCLGVMGSTGNSTGTHLHFEIILNGVRMDPQKYIDFSVPFVDSPDTFFPPAIPPMAYVTPIEGVNIRYGAGTSYPTGGYAGEGERLEVLGVHQVGQDIWLRIGHCQYVCALYQGRALLRVVQ